MILYERNMIACCGTRDLPPLPECIWSLANPQTYSHSYASYWYIYTDAIMQMECSMCYRSTESEKMVN